MSRYRYNYNTLPTSAPNRGSSSSLEEDEEERAWKEKELRAWDGLKESKLPSQTLFQELEEEEERNKLIKEDFISSEYSFQMMTPKGAFSFSPANQKYEAYLQSIFLFILNLNPNFSESAFVKKIREALFSSSASASSSSYVPLSSFGESDTLSREERRKLAAKEYLDTVVKTNRYDLCILHIPQSKSGHSIGIMLRHGINIKKANKIIYDDSRFTLTAKKAFSLYTELRALNVVLSISPYEKKRPQIFSKEEQEKLLSPLPETLRIVNPGLKTKRKKRTGIKVNTFTDVIRIGARK